MKTEAAPALLEGLNERQREAVLCTEGPLLVIAGPGSGKTRVITTRIAYLIAKGAQPSSILALTFTKKAAGEMADRVAALVGMRLPWVSTFHSMCAKILRIEAEAAGVPAGYTIYDEDDQNKIIKLALKKLNLDPHYYRPASISDYISSMKQKLIAPDKAYGGGITTARMPDIYEEYERLLKENGALDFDDLLLRTAMLFKNNPGVLKKYQERFRYILVDEYQDTNRLQYVIVERLAAAHVNICVTGDPDQSIYGWRGATISNILDFEGYFKGCRVVRLEQNYRSTGRILKGASAVIKNNTERKEKELWTEGEEGEPIELAFTEDETAEAGFIAGRILDLALKGRSLSDVAVFYRTTPQSRAIEQALIHAKIPYAIVGGVQFFQRMEVKDVISYLNLALNPRDGISFARALGAPPRGAGEKTIEDAKLRAADKGLTLIDALDGLAKEGAGRSKRRAGLAEFTRLIRDITAMKDSSPPSDIIADVFKRSGLAEHLEEMEDGEDRIANVEELITAAVEFEKRSEDKTLAAFLRDVALLTQVDSYKSSGDSRVVLMTLHCAKGLEFDSVFVTGIEDHLLPHKRALDEGGDHALEEERRLLYVGMTRAKRKLILTSAKSRRFGGSLWPSIPSRFIAEIPEMLLDVKDLAPSAVFESRKPRVAWHDKNDDLWGEENAPQPKPSAAPPAKSFDDEMSQVPFELAKGDRVSHDKFGTGVVEEVSGNGLSMKAVVNFTFGGRKKLSVQHAKLKKQSC